MAQREMPWTLDLIYRARPWQVGAALRVLLGYRSGEHDVSGFRLWLDPASNMGYRLLRDGDLESDMTHGLERILRPGDTFVDLGGNEGWYSLIAGRKVGPKGRVLCVEPQERLWPTILRNFELNRMPQCELVPVAVGEEGKAEITLAPAVNTGASSMTVKRKIPLLHKRQSVLVRPLDDLCDERGIRDVRLVKVDIEGFELNALRSAKRLLGERRIANLLIEFHDAELRRLGQSRDEVLSLLQENGYREVTGEHGIHHFSCE